MCIIEIQIYLLHGKYSKSVISRDDGVCSSYTEICLQISIKLVRYV